MYVYVYIGLHSAIYSPLRNNNNIPNVDIYTETRGEGYMRTTNFTYTGIHIHTHAYIFIYIYVCVCVYICIYLYTCV